MYRGYEISKDSIVGGLLISKDGEFVDRVLGDIHLARSTVDDIIFESGVVMTKACEAEFHGECSRRFRAKTHCDCACHQKAVMD